LQSKLKPENDPSMFVGQGVKNGKIDLTTIFTLIHKMGD